MRTLLITPDHSVTVLRLAQSGPQAATQLRQAVDGVPDPVQVGALTFWCSNHTNPNALAGLLAYQLSGEVHHFRGPVVVGAGPRQDLSPSSLAWLLRSIRLLAGQESALNQFQVAGQIQATWLASGTPSSVHHASGQ